MVEAVPPLTDLSDQAPVGLVALTPDGMVRDTNQAAEQMLGMSRRRLVGRALGELLVKDTEVANLMQHARDYRSDTSAPDVSIKPIGLVSEFRATVRVRWFHSGELVLALSPALSRQSHDPVIGVASFGRILGHEIKNPLAGISGAAQLLLRQAPASQRELLTLICEEAGRIERLVNRFSAFELFSAPQLEPLNIHAVLDKVMSAEEAAFDGQLSFTRRYDPSLPELMGDSDHLHEAFQNIVRNGVEAALANANARKPAVLVRTAFEAGFARRQSSASKALRRALRVDVIDTGTEMAKVDTDKLFETFASSKSPGRGLGLTVVKEVVTAHGGLVEVNNTAEGTRVSVFLPIGSGA